MGGVARANDALEAFERNRHVDRPAVPVAAVREGMSIGDLSRAWAFSRQLAARTVREAVGEV
jgi:hypothetical protein